jgi:hypothetical protein
MNALVYLFFLKDFERGISGKVGWDAINKHYKRISLFLIIQAFTKKMFALLS